MVSNVLLLRRGEVGCAASGRTSDVNGSAGRYYYGDQRADGLDILIVSVAQTAAKIEVARRAEQLEERSLKRGGVSVMYATFVDTHKWYEISIRSAMLGRSRRLR